MKAAVICPTSMLGWLQKEFSLRFHLVLVQVYLRDRKYAKFFLERRQAGDTVLLDQGAAELGAAVGDKDIMRVVRELKPTIVVAPDVIHDSVQTVLRTATFLVSYEDELGRLGVQIMAVPQGDTKDHYLACFSVFNTDRRVSWLGISKFYYQMFGSRRALLLLVQDRVKKPCHLLGAEGTTSSLQHEKFSFVGSTDTAKPVKLGLQGLKLSEADKRSSVKDFFSCPPTNLELVKQNVKEYLEAVR